VSAVLALRSRLAVAWLGVGSILLLAGAQACLAEVEPDVGPVRAGVCVNEDSNTRRDVSFRTEILPLFERPFGQAGCGCHMPSSRRTSGIDATGLDLSTYTSVMAGGTSSGDTVVIPGDACGSLLVQKTSAAPPSGARMPSDGPPYLSPSEQGLIKDWIVEGAREN
jgi:hypothetical protein